MRTGSLIVVLMFIVSQGYVVWHLWKITPGGWPIKLLVVSLFLLWMVIAFANMAMSEIIPIRAAYILTDLGHPWLIAFLYLLIVFIIADILSLCMVLPRHCLDGSIDGLLGILGIVAIVLVAGGIHYKHKYREDLTISTDKPLEKPLTIVLASDLHIGYSNRKPDLSRWIDMMNSENPDLILFGGDIVDLRLRPVTEGNYADEFRRLNAPSFAVLGNHEYYGDVKGSEQFLSNAGITLLRDSVAHYKGIEIIGRDDRSNQERMPLTDLAGSMHGFTILLDHQPVHLEESEQMGIDFQFSGHTHHGQVWPLSWVTDVIFEKAWGHHSRGNTQYYVSSGLGIWGPKIRVGTRSEYLVLHLYSSCLSSD